MSGRRYVVSGLPAAFGEHPQTRGSTTRRLERNHVSTTHQPTREHKFSFALWNVGWRAGDATRRTVTGRVERPLGAR